MLFHKLWFLFYHPLNVLTPFTSIFRRNKVNCYCYLNFLCIRFLEIIYVFQVWFNLVNRVLFLPRLLPYSILLLSIVVQKIAYSYWFVIKLFFLLRKVFVVSNYSVFDCFISFSLKRFFTCLLCCLLIDFWFSWFLSTTIHIVSMCWFTIIHGYVWFKKTQNVIFIFSFIFNHPLFLQSLKYS